MRRESKLPNVVLIVADALRADRLHCYGNPWHTSPVIDRLAGEGVLFRQLIAHSSHTLPCVASIFTGLDPISHGLNDPRTHIQHNWGKWKSPLNIVEDRGYTLGAFDAYMYFHFGRHIHIENGAQAAPFFEANREKSFFMWQFLEQVHLPYDPHPPYDTAFLPKDCRISQGTAERLKAVRSTMIIHRPGLISQFELDQAKGRGNAFEADADRQIEYRRSAASMEFQSEDRVPIAALYDGEVRTLDDLIGEYINKLEALGILDETIVVVTSDHGEELLERGSVGHSSCSLAGSLYEEAIRVPMVIRYPRSLPRGKVVETQVSQTDIMPTIFELAGLRMPAETQGRSLLPLIRGQRPTAPEETFAETLPCGWQTQKDDHRRIWCMRTPKWKLIYNQFAPQAADSCELYDLENDRGEKNNVLERNPGVAADMKRRLHDWMKREPMRF
jgi:arylsulfatase A-like enzyme